MKTYSVAIQNKLGQWITNWGRYSNLDDINWQEVKTFCLQRKDKAFGYYYGNKSNELTSGRCRTVLETL